MAGPSSDMPHALLTASRVAARTHLLRQQVGLLHVADAVIVSFFQQFFRLKSQRGLSHLIFLVFTTSHRT